MNQYDLSHKNMSSTSQVFNWPMLLISLGLHTLLLLIPKPSQPPPQTLKPEPQPEETVKVSDLLGSTSSSSPKPSPKASKSTSKKTVSTKKATPTPRQQVVSRPSVSQLQPSRSKQTSELAAATEPVTNPDSSSGTDRESTETATPAAEAEEFQKLFGKLEGEVDEKLIDPNVFEKPDSFYTKESLNAGGEPERKPGIDRIKWISLKAPDVVLDELKPQLKGIGIEPTTQGQYGGGTVYQVKKGSSVRYINLVPTKGSIGTLVIVWNRDPSISAK